MEYKAEKKRFLQSLVNNRIPQVNFLAHAREMGVAAPKEVLMKWMRRFYANPTTLVYDGSYKTVNKFCIGADPEFCFGLNQGIGAEPRYAHSEGLGLNTIEAFGSDMTGRQAELRAFPDRSALRVVASLLTTLRFLPHKYPETLSYMWLADAYMAGDGVGGHVHFGRKRPNRDVSIKSLDALTMLLTYSQGCIDGAGQLTRSSTTNYGKTGDIRVQPHGYEYRTMPTWMASPRSAFITLTLAKLCVFHNLEIPKTIAKEPDKNHTQIVTLLRMFATVDDDARLALHTIEKFGIGKIIKYSDFKANWGITENIVAAKPKDRDKMYIPPVIKPTEDSVKELFDLLVTGKKLGYYVPKPNWEPYLLEKDVRPLTYLRHRAGLPEIAAGLLCKKYPVSLQVNSPGNRQFYIYVPSGFAVNAFDLNKQASARNCKFGKIQIREGLGADNFDFHIPFMVENRFVVDKDVVADCRWLLYKSGFFPIAKAEDIGKINLDSYGKKKEVSLIGNLIYQVAGVSS